MSVSSGDSETDDEDWNRPDVKEGRGDKTAGLPYTNHGRNDDVWVPT